MERIKRILAVDDYVDNLITLSALIDEFFPDVEVMTASSGRDALSLSNEFAFDIAIFDVVMPEMDGFELCKKFKVNPLQKDVPIIFVTASKGSRDNRIKALEAGGDAFLAKPIEEPELVAQIKAMFKIRDYFLEKTQEQNRLSNMVVSQTEALKEKNQQMEHLLAQLKRENESRKYQQEILLEVQNMAKIGSFEYFLSGKEFFASEMFWTICGSEETRYTHELSFFYNLLFVEDLVLFNEQIDLLETEKEMVEFVCDIRDGNGIKKSVSIKMSRIIDERGGIAGYRGMIQDVSEMKDKEKALEKATVEAENANHAQSRFLANMSHEIRTPLNGIIGMINLSLLTNLSQEQEEYLETAQSSAQSLLTIIGDILDYSKIEADKLEFMYESIEIGEFLSTFDTLFSVSAHRKNLKLKIEMDSNLPNRIIADRVRLSQIMSNLLGNAVKFTEEGEVVCSVKMIDKDSTHVKVAVSVKDTGIGISPDDLDTLFNRFTQAYHPEKKLYGGTGLGLAITKRLISMMGSELKCSSVLGEGSDFYFTLSVPYEDELLQGEKKEVLLETFDEFNIGGLDILVADDDLVNQKMIKAFLEKNQVKVSVVDNGLEAVEFLETKHVDLILLDVNMPVLSGFDAVQIIKQKNELKDIPVVAVTAYAMSGDKEKCLLAGFDDYVTKPVDFNILKKVVSRNTTC